MKRRRKSRRGRRNPFAFNRPRRRHRRSFRRNPFSLGGTRGVIGTVTGGLQTGLGIAVGVATSKTVNGFVPASLKTSALSSLAASTVVATIIGAVAHKIVGPKWGASIAGGAWFAVIQNLTGTYQVPFLSAALHGYVPFAGYVPLNGGPLDAMNQGYDLNAEQEAALQ